MLDDRARRNRLLSDLQAYLDAAVGIDLRPSPCEHRPLPTYLTHAFDLECGTILGHECVFALDRGHEKLTPSAIEKRFKRLRADFAGQQPVFVTPGMTSRERKRLVERRIPFIAPFAQLYLPPLGIDFHDKLRPREVWPEPLHEEEPFKPATQVVLLWALQQERSIKMQVTPLAETLRYSQMSISRALRDLEAAGLVERPAKGQKRPARLVHERLETWRQAQPLLQSPARKRYATSRRNLPGALLAGISALATMSNIAAPRQPTIAVSPKIWKDFKAAALVEPLAPHGVVEPDQMIVETWTYAPDTLSTGPTVDVLSLHLSLRDNQDERVEAALEEAMETLKW